MNIMREIVGRERVRDSFLTDVELGGGPLLGGRVYVGHVPYSWRAHTGLRSARRIVLGRDPRDVVTSIAMAHFKRKIPDDGLTQLIQRLGLSLSEVIDLVMLGDNRSAQFPSVTELFDRYHLRWRGSADVVLTYEELLAALEDPAARDLVRGKLMAALQTDLEPTGFEECLKRGSDPAISPTFERGRVGTWSEVWSARNLETFRSIAPDLLKRLGYEIGQPDDSPAVARSVPQFLTSVAAESISLGELWGELDAMKGTIEQLRAPKDHVPERTSFVPVPTLGLGLFCWTDDSFHAGLGHVAASDEDLEDFVASNASADAASASLPGLLQPIVELIRPYLEAHGAVHFVDVGCHYGGEVILVAKRLSSHGDRFRATALDPGIAGQLVPWNLKLNGVDQRVKFLPVGSSNRSGVDLVYGEYGQSENCRIVTRIVSTETFSYPCQVASLDELLGTEATEHALFLKLDIQGGEWNALLGAQRAMRDHRLLGVMVKFVPSVIRSFGEPAEFTRLLPDGWALYELPYYQFVIDDMNWTEIMPEQFRDYALTLDRSAPDAFSLLLFVWDGTLKNVIGSRGRTSREAR